MVKDPQDSVHILDSSDSEGEESQQPVSAQALAATAAAPIAAAAAASAAATNHVSSPQADEQDESFGIDDETEQEGPRLSEIAAGAIQRGVVQGRDSCHALQNSFVGNGSLQNTSQSVGITTPISASGSTHFGAAASSSSAAAAMSVNKSLFSDSVSIQVKCEQINFPQTAFARHIAQQGAPVPAGATGATIRTGQGTVNINVRLPRRPGAQGPPMPTIHPLPGGPGGVAGAVIGAIGNMLQQQQQQQNMQNGPQAGVGGGGVQQNPQPLPPAPAGAAHTAIPPMARYGHSSVIINAKQKGVLHVPSYAESQSGKKRKREDAGQQSSQSASSSNPADHIDDASPEPILLVYGGNTADSNTNQLYEFNIRTHYWNTKRPQHTSSGTWPTKLIYHSAFVRPGCKYPYDNPDCDRMIVFGGTPTKNSVVDDIWEYTYATNSWRRIEPVNIIDNDKPPVAISKRRSASVAYRKSTDSFIVFGGYDGNKYLADCYEFSFVSKTWRVIDTFCSLANGDEAMIPALHGHSAVMVDDDSKMVVVGCADPVDTSPLRLFELDADRCTWREIDPEGTYRPKPRKHTVAQMYTDKHMVLLGGIGSKRGADFDDFVLFDFSTRQWHPLVFNGGVIPKSKAWHTGVVDHSSHPSTILMYGGKCEHQHRSEEMYSLRIPSVLAKEVIRLSSSAAIADFAKLFPDPSQTFRKLSDIVLVSGDNVEFHVHKNILACRSQFFGTLFTGEYADSETARMQFEFVQSDVLETILKFIYGHGKIEISTNLDNKTSKLIEIATAANMLLMDDLQLQVLSLLESNINKTNVIEILRFAKDIGAAGIVLKEACFNSLRKSDLMEMVEFLLEGATFMPDASQAPLVDASVTMPVESQASGSVGASSRVISSSKSGSQPRLADAEITDDQYSSDQDEKQRQPKRRKI